MGQSEAEEEWIGDLREGGGEKGDKSRSLVSGAG